MDRYVMVLGALKASVRRDVALILVSVDVVDFGDTDIEGSVCVADTTVLYLQVVCP